MAHRSVEIRQDEYSGATSVPNEFIDRFMAQAPGEYVKIYLYLLRCLYDREGCFSFARAAQLFDSTEGDIRRALLFWEDMGLLTLDCSGDVITGISLCDTAACIRAGSSCTRARGAARTGSSADDGAVPDYAASKIRSFCADEEIGQVIFVAGQYLGHRLQHRELCFFYYWYTEMGFSADLMIDLVDLCVSDGCSDMEVLHQCALEWHAAQVHTADDARAYMKQRRARRIRNEEESDLAAKICSTLGIAGRSLNDAELAYMRRWSDEWSFSGELICEACRRTIANTHQASFSYAETILRNWRRDGITDAEGVRTHDEAYHARRKSSRRTDGKNACARNASSGRRSKYDELELLTMANI